jgi:hypothetical protein
LQLTFGKNASVQKSVGPRLQNVPAHVRQCHVVDGKVLIRVGGDELRRVLKVMWHDEQLVQQAPAGEHPNLALEIGAQQKHVVRLVGQDVAHACEPGTIRPSVQFVPDSGVAQDLRA